MSKNHELAQDSSRYSDAQIQASIDSAGIKLTVRGARDVIDNPPDPTHQFYAYGVMLRRIMNDRLRVDDLRRRSQRN